MRDRNGETHAGIHCLYALARAYGCDVRKLMGFYGLA
jgi:hypothetical protein